MPKRITPDSVASLAAGDVLDDISTDEWAELQQTWPVAADALEDLWNSIRQGRVSEATSSLDISVYTLTWEYISGLEADEQNGAAA